MNTTFGFAIVAVLVIAAIAGVTYSVFILLNPSRTAADRLSELTQQKEEDLPLLAPSDDPGAANSLWNKIAGLAKPATQEEQDQLRRRLLQAGYRNRHALELYNGLRVTMAVAMPVLCAPIVGTSSMLVMAGAVGGSALFGYYVPTLIVNNNVEKRKASLLAAFPDAMDLLVSSVEAGLGVDAAFRRVAEEIKQASPELGREFQLVNHEISAGMSRLEAMRHLEKRTGLDEIRSLVNMLTQADRFGTSIAKSLRVHSRITRAKRMARAEELAAQVSPKITIVMILFLLPCLAAILLGPALIRVSLTFAKKNG